jgi:hypothetical protein
MFGGPPPFLQLVDAMAAMGMFTRKGVQIVHDVWTTLDFVDVQRSDEARALTHETLERLEAARLISDDATEGQVRWLYNSWQMPMYALEFSEVAVPLEELEAQREAAFWNEYGV